MGLTRKTGLIAVVVIVLSAVAGGAVAVADPVVMAAGDIACAATGPTSPGTCSQAYTANLLLAQKSSAEGLAAVLTLGDNQYESGALADFRSYFDPTWGRLGSILRPALGNHEYQTAGASGYFDYFSGLGVPTGNRGDGWYSYDIGSWHLFALNSSDGCTPVLCTTGSPQETWLRSDLTSTAQPCIVAYWHHPLSYAPAEKAIWQDLYDAGADLMLVGHEHTYRKPVAHDASGSPDATGPREVIVGTGGYSGGIYGVLKLTLHAGSFDWSFVGTGATDSGTAACHGPRLPPPSPPTASFTASASGLAVSFKDTSTGAPTSWSWTFGDGTTSSAQSPSHTYAQAGTYTVTLTATNSGGSTSATQQVILTAPPPGTLTVNARDDAQVKSTTPGKKYGSLPTLSVREATVSADVTYRTYLKFQVSGLTGTVSDVRLKLKVDGSSGSDGPDSGDVYLVSGTSWSESTLSWSNAPAIVTLPVGTAVAAPLGGTIQIDLHTAITSDGTYTLALKSHSTDTVTYTSKEGGSPPQLLLTTG